MSVPDPSSRFRPSDEDVREFLRDRPDFLAENLDLYRFLAPPVRVHGEALADHMEARLRATQRDVHAMSTQTRRVLAAGRAASGFVQRVQAAVLSLIEARCATECIESEFPALLGVDAAALCVEDRAGPGRRLPTGTIARLLSGRPVVLRRWPPDARLLHAEAAALAASDALVRVPNQKGPALLALACRDGALHEGGSVGPLTFLGRAVGAALAR